MTYTRAALCDIATACRSRRRPTDGRVKAVVCSRTRFNARVLSADRSCSWHLNTLSWQCTRVHIKLISYFFSFADHHRDEMVALRWKKTRRRGEISLIPPFADALFFSERTFAMPRDDNISCLSLTTICFHREKSNAILKSVYTILRRFRYQITRRCVEILFTILIVFFFHDFTFVLFFFNCCKRVCTFFKIYLI